MPYPAAREHPKSTPCVKKLRGSSVGVREVAKNTVPRRSPLVENECHSPIAIWPHSRLRVNNSFAWELVANLTAQVAGGASAASSDRPQCERRLEHPAALSEAASILALHASPPMTCACTAAMPCATLPRAMVSDLRNLSLCRHRPQGSRGSASDCHCNCTNQRSDPVFCHHEVPAGKVPRLRMMTTAALDAKTCATRRQIPSKRWGAGDAPPTPAPVF
jgi:hypothetical protein